MKEHWVFPNLIPWNPVRIVMKWYERMIYQPKTVYLVETVTSIEQHTISLIGSKFQHMYLLKNRQNSQVHNFKMTEGSEQHEHPDKVHIEVETMVLLLVLLVLFCTICVCVSNRDTTRRSNIIGRTWSLRPKKCKDVIPGSKVREEIVKQKVILYMDDKKDKYVQLQLK